ncbi:MAG: hypothetical protein DHS20C21_23140 [Gemmatimonadota bacterium]|nr:MAG: hypothetical protein DHS20C21_23140 [Gemmatimonadota bacterium]
MVEERTHPTGDRLHLENELLSKVIGENEVLRGLPVARAVVSVMVVRFLPKGRPSDGHTQYRCDEERMRKSHLFSPSFGLAP